MLTPRAVNFAQAGCEFQRTTQNTIPLTQTNGVAMAEARELAIDALLDFQRAELERLVSARSELDVRLEAAREKVRQAGERVVAARALVEARKGGATLHEREPRTRDNAAEWVRRESKEDADDGTPTIVPIGIVYTELQKRYEAPRQAFTGGTSSGVVIFRSSEHVPQGLEIGRRVLLVYHFDRNGSHWRDFVRPPRRVKDAGRVGLFATRSPNRPTPIGLSFGLITGLDLDNCRVYMDGLDILDETPLIGARLYTEADAFDTTAVHMGWLEESDVVRPLHYDESKDKLLQVSMDAQVKKKLSFIATRTTVDVEDMVLRSLQRGHGKKGILPVGAFRVLFEPDPSRPDAVHVLDVVSGFRDMVCRTEADTDPEAALHAKFKAHFSKPH